MKKTLLLLSFLFPFMLLQAQEKEVFHYKNNIQFNPIDAFLFGSLDFQYERAITENTTLSFILGIKPYGGLLTINGFDSPTIKTNDLKFTGYTFTPEYRWYFQKERKSKRTGFYVGAYYRFRNFDNDVKGTYTSSISRTSSPIDVSVNLKTHSLGAMLGYKVMFNKHFYCDILILGLGYGSANLDFIERKPLPEEFYLDVSAKIMENLDIISEIVEDIEINKTNENKGQGSFGFPSLRYGFKIGYSF